MSLTRKLNYYQDTSGYYHRIPWDTWLEDGVEIGLSPVGILNDDVIEFDSDGFVDGHVDFLDISEDETEESDVSSLSLQSNERTFLDSFDNVCFFYQTDCGQTPETDYDKPSEYENN